MAAASVDESQRSAKKCKADVFYVAVFEVGREGERPGDQNLKDAERFPKG